MKKPHISFKPLTKSWSHHIVGVFTLVSMFWIGWMGWQSYEQWQDKPLPPDRVSAKQLRVNESQRQKLVTDLATYHDPAATLPHGSVTFQGGTTTTNTSR